MVQIDSLLRSNLDKEWYAINDRGHLTTVKKDVRIIRVLKTMIGNIFGVDFYAHIRYDRVVQALLDRAKDESSSNKISQIIENLQTKTGRQTAPYLTFDPELKCYTPLNLVRQKSPRRSFTQNERTLLANSKAVGEAILGNQAAQTLNESDPRAILIKAAYRSIFRSVPRDRQNNLWFGMRLHWRVVTTINSKNVQTTASGHKVTVPSWKWNKTPTIKGPKQTFFIRTSEKIKAPIKILLEDQEADIDHNGQALLPNGRKIEMKWVRNTHDMMYVGDPSFYDFTLNILE